MGDETKESWSADQEVLSDSRRGVEALRCRAFTPLIVLLAMEGAFVF